MNRPVEVVAIAAYHALFSLLLLGTLVWQARTHSPSGGWLRAAPVIAMMLFVSLVPAVIAIGLWLMDNSARVACLIFTLLHMMSTVLYLEHAPAFWRPWARLSLDVAILTLLMVPRIRRAFERESRLLLEFRL